MEDLLLTVVPANVHEIPEFVDPPTPATFQYHTADEVPLQPVPEHGLFDLSSLGMQPIELLMPTRDDQLRLLILDDASFDDEYDQDDEDDDDEVDIVDVDEVPAPTRRTWMMHLHNGALTPITSGDSFSFPRGTLRTVMFELRVAPHRTVQIHLTGVCAETGDNDPVLAAMLARTERRSSNVLRNVVFRGDVMFSGACDDESLMALSEVHTAAVAAVGRLQNLRSKRLGKSM